MFFSTKKLWQKIQIITLCATLKFSPSSASIVMPLTKMGKIQTKQLISFTKEWLKSLQKCRVMKMKIV